ncbi:MAG: T9SS type A sorting domain-containing protein [Balneolaceae bacterium]|nr:T9SS type A sorting domain-containing protein [Balneolaceae bacterium]MBO6545424.1 T9SS type A sorting domain-containing protein [Balneolaceae bacterium]MBO6646820.1 T9SS type A sorting domain-containing protein [Balneolaceae bacterium]
MKKFTLLLIIFSIGTGALVAQNNTKERIEAQYFNSTHKAFLYQVSPHVKQADDWVLSLEEVAGQAIFAEMAALSNLPQDTSWGYSEWKNLMDTMFTPQTFSRRFYEGDTLSYIYRNNQYVWSVDSTRWMPQRIQNGYFSEGHNDSSTTYFYQSPYVEPYTGQRSITPGVPAEGATREQFWDYYSPDNGWQKGSRDLSYQDEFGWDTLRLSYQYEPELMDYQLNSLQRRKNAENYYYFYNEGYFGGILNSTELQENTLEYLLRRVKYFDGEGMQTSGYFDYTKLGDGGRYIYQISKEYDSEGMNYVGEDSLHFTYAPDDSYTDAEGFFWDDSTWVFYNAYTSYQREHPVGDMVVDSILVFEIGENEETMEPERKRVSIKTEMDYDEHANQVEVRNFSIIDDTLRLNNKTVRMFREFTNFNNESYFAQTKQETYTRDFFTGEIYHSGVNETLYGSDGSYQGSKNFSFNAEGDTTFGFHIQRDLLSDGSTIEVRFDWDFSEKRLLLKSYRIYNRRISGGEGQSFNQTVNKSFIGNQEAINRSMSLYTSYPGVFNDGPILISPGDTVSLYVSAMSPDMTIPTVEVSNMPSTATFDPETRRFFWVVDETNPSPMTYKAIRGETFVTAEVEFVNEQFAVGTEEEVNPNEFRLSQNYPNPFNPSTNISFNLPSSGEVTLKVYNLLGQEVVTLVNGRLNSGSHTVAFDASRLASGMYIYRLQAGSHLQTKKMLLIK